MSFVRVRDITVHYVLEGPENAPVVMFSNSLGTNLQIWDAQAAALRGKYRVLRYDTRGHGLTDAPDAGDAGYSMEQLADDAIALIQALGLTKVTLCGLSVGGMLGQNFGAKAPQFLNALILCDTAAHMNPAIWDERIAIANKTGSLESLADPSMQRWFTPPFHKSNPDAIKGIRNMFVRTPLAGFIGCAHAIRRMDLRADGARIVTPTLVIVGENDPATTVAEARELNAAIKGSKLTIIPSAAHIVPVEQPAAVTKAIGDFLAAH